MSSKYLNALANVSFIVRLQWVFIAILALLAIYAMYGWQSTPKDFIAHIPPDLRSGAHIKIGDTPDVPPANVYTFALYIWQMVNRWQTDGNKNYGEQIFALQDYITPACREQLIADMNSKSIKGELTQRTRALMEIPGQTYSEKRVIPQGPYAWQVNVDAQLIETSRGIPVKDTYIRYPVRVVRFNVDRERNPFELAIDCYGPNARPERLNPKSMKLLAAPSPSDGGIEPATLPNAVTP